MGSGTNAAARFLRNPRHKNGYWSKQCRCFVINGRRFEGVKKPLERLFFNNYSMKLAWQKRSRGQDSKIKAASRVRGTTRGTMLHKQVQAWANAQIGKAKPRKAKMHPLAEQVVQVIQKMKVIVVGVEVLIYDERLGIATRIDLLVVHEESGLFMSIELKFGFDGFATIPTGTTRKLSPPLEDWPNNEIMHWQLQSLMNGILLAKHYQVRMAPIGPLIIWSHSRGVEVLTLKDRTLEKAAVIYRTLENRKRKRATNIKVVEKKKK